MRQIKVLAVPVDSKPYMKTIDDHIETLQALVGGYIETLTTPEGYVIVMNEKGKQEGLTPNIRLGFSDYIAGDFFVVGFDGIEDFESITEEQAKHFIEKYVRLNKVKQT